MRNQYRLESESTPGKEYIVTEQDFGAFEWQCSCVGWTRHMPRRDCKHIKWVKQHGAVPIDPFLRLMEKVTAKEERRVAV